MRSEELLLVRDECFQRHVAPTGHPERPERLVAIDRALGGLAESLPTLEPRRASDEEILRVHSHEVLSELRALAGKTGRIDADTFLSERSLEIAELAAGSSVELALRLARGDSRRAFALVRPPGHHAERGQPMGFCLLNNVAIAVEALRAEARLERIAIVDWDVHHGNGTQHLFEEERDVLFLSLHQFPFYPGTGALEEGGLGAGIGSTVNLPLPAGCGDAEYCAVFREIVVPILHEFRPEIVLVSAGFDAHARDPLAAMQVSSAGFGFLAACLRQLADEVCEGRLLLSLEGGYDLEGLGSSVREVLDVLTRKSDALDPVPEVGSIATENLIRLFRDRHSERWTSLRIPDRDGR